MAVSGPVTEVIRAAGDHVPGLLVRVEERLAELAAGHGVTLAEHAGATIAAGGKRLRPLLVFLAADEEDGEGLAAAMARAGLRDIRWILTAGGIIAIHVGTKA